MRKLGVLGVAILSSAATWFLAQGARPIHAQAPAGAPAVTWEYNVVGSVNPGRFNQLGEEGWEMCAAVKEDHKVPTFVFKRPKR